MANKGLVEEYGFDRFEVAEKVLTSNKSIENFHKEREYNGRGGDLERYFVFTVRGQEYCIEVWANMYYLWIGEARVLFYRFEIRDTWPDEWRHIHFLYNKGTSTPFGMQWDVVALIPLEKKWGE